MSKPTGQTMDWSPEARAAQSRQEFIEAWQQALRDGGEPPSLERILSVFDEPPSVEFRQDLESLDSLFRQRWSSSEWLAPGGATVHFTPGATVDGAAAGKAPDTVTAHAELALQGLGRGTGPNADRETGPDAAPESGSNVPNAENIGRGSNGDAGTLALEAALAGRGTDATGVYDPIDLSAHDPANAATRAFFGDDTPDARHAARKAPVAVPEKVAGYEILGVLGRGGMGVVYKARQPGLKRLVALKMILAGGHASAEDLARFRSEAEAVARLQHPNIVQVYEIGEEDGRPYFSLEFVEGASLVQKLEGKPQTPRQAAEMIHVLAQAMAVAHAQGVIHRDLKPANILVSQDGTLKITDFGLAKRLEDEEGGQTRSGSILGTPDYMSPEQASGRIREVGPAADVYALGAMLYEMLAGRVPLRGSSVLDTLQQVVMKEPVSPTQLDPKVPRDLETICLKCLRKDPAKRYARVDDLAEDLRRFMAGEPILARPVSKTERAWRWCKRNPRVATLSGVVGLMVLAWAASASLVALKFKEKNVQIATALESAETNEGKAIANERAAKLQETEARHQATIAKEQAQRAEENAEAAKKQHGRAADLLVELGIQLEKRLQASRSVAERPELRQLQQELLDMVSAAVSNLSKQIEDAHITDFGMAVTCNRLGELLFKLGHGEEALAQYRYGYELVKRVAEKDPKNDLARSNMGLLLMQMGKMCLEVNDDAQTAREYFLQARELQQAIADQPQNNANQSDKDHHRLLSMYEFHAGVASLHLGRPDEALKSFEAALNHRQAWLKLEPNGVMAMNYLAQAHQWIGIVEWHLGDVEKTQDHFRQALTICHNLANGFPNNYGYQRDLAEIYGDYCDAKLRIGLPDGARLAVEKSREFLEAFLAHHPDDVSEQPLLALTYERQARVALRLGQKEEARRHFDEARELRSELVVIEPGNQAWQMALALAQAHCGEHAAAAKLAQDTLARSPDHPGLVLQAARTWAACAAETGGEEQAAYRKRAIEALRTATSGDFRDGLGLQTDPDLSLLANEGDFATLLGEIKARTQ